MRHFLPKISTITSYYLTRVMIAKARSPARKGLALAATRQTALLVRCSCPVVPPNVVMKSTYGGTTMYIRLATQYLEHYIASQQMHCPCATLLTADPEPARVSEHSCRCHAPRRNIRYSEENMSTVGDTSRSLQG